MNSWSVSIASDGLRLKQIVYILRDKRRTRAQRRTSLSVSELTSSFYSPANCWKDICLFLISILGANVAVICVMKIEPRMHLSGMRDQETSLSP